MSRPLFKTELEKKGLGIDPSTEMHDCLWFFGRGASISAGLDWWPSDETWRLPREEQIATISRDLRQEEEGIPSNNAHRLLFEHLGRRTLERHKHTFLTLNWDTLLQSSLANLLHGVAKVPSWLRSSYVYHLNGSIDPNPTPFCSSFVLPNDELHLRTASTEFETSLTQLAWASSIVVVGASLSWNADAVILEFMRRYQDNFPIGEAAILVVDSAPEDVAGRLAPSLPGANIRQVRADFSAWVGQGMPELVELGICGQSRGPLISILWQTRDLH